MLREIARPVANDAVERLIPADAPTRPRAVAVIDGVLGGRVWTDDPDAPTAVLVVEDADGTVYAGGDLTPETLRDTLAGVATASGDLIFGSSGPDDPLRALVPAEPYWRGEAIDFTDRVPPADEADRLAAPLPEGAELRPLDAGTLPLIEWYADTVHAFGSVEAWERHGLGYAAFLDGVPLAECVAGPRTRGLLEMGVVTREAHRRKGLGTLVSAAVARAAEARGDRVWWNANAANAPSLAIARRLGFTRERRYDLVACHAPLDAGGEAAVG
jgi:RimJ/RimL family protein N-acetyltransferase